jgi:hypothetical protein
MATTSGGESRQVPIMDIFNNAAYELIPVTGAVVTPWLVMRITLIDIWTLELVKRLGQIDAKYADHQMASRLATLKETRAAIAHMSNDILFPKTCFGKYESPSIYKKKLLQKVADDRRMFFPGQRGTSMKPTSAAAPTVPVKPTEPAVPAAPTHEKK